MPQGSYSDKGILSRVFLVGFMCSGKTTVGGILAERLGWDFVDVDTEIERREGMRITRIFETKGESYFRKLELDILRELSCREGVVISTGGGLGANPEAMDLMKSRGIVIWLDVSFEEFMRRCGKDKNRPLLRLGERKLREVLKERSRVYARAHLRVSGEEGPERIVQAIISNLSGDPS